jgi:multisubunit Na+/H+ antiporter MnhC subunit
MDSESIRLWLESQGWYEYLNWLLAQPSDPYVSALFLIGIVIGISLLIIVFSGGNSK